MGYIGPWSRNCEQNLATRTVQQDLNLKEEEEEEEEEKKKKKKKKKKGMMMMTRMITIK